MIYQNKGKSYLNNIFVIEEYNIFSERDFQKSVWSFYQQQVV